MHVVRVDKFELQGSPAKLSAVWKAVICNLHSTNWSARYWKYAQKYSFVKRHFLNKELCEFMEHDNTSSRGMRKMII